MPAEGPRIRPLRVDGPTPNGGAYGVYYCRDPEGRPAPPEDATHAEYVEYDDHDRAIHRTYLTVDPVSPPPESPPPPAPAPKLTIRKAT